MIEKIVSLSEAVEVDEMPIDRGAVMRRIMSVPEDIMQEYLNVFNDHLENLAAYKNVLISRGKPNLFRHLLDSLTEHQIASVEKISIILAAKEPEKLIRELLEVSFDILTPTPESISKAIVLIKLIKSLDSDHADKIVKLAKYIKVLSDVIIDLKMGETFEVLVADYLSNFSEGDLDQLIEHVSCNKNFTDTLASL